MSEITRYNDVNLDMINYKKPSKQSNVYYSEMSYGDSKPFYIQTPRLKYKDIVKDTLRSSCNPDDFGVYDFLLNLDDKNTEQTYKLSKEWFNKELPMDIIENMYRRITIPFKKGDIPQLDFKVPMIKNKVKCNIYDQSNNLINLESIKPNAEIICIIHVKGLKFLKKDFYCDCYISQIKLCENTEFSIPDECLIEEEIYEFEVVDEEILQKTKLREELQKEYSKKESELNELQKQIDELN